MVECRGQYRGLKRRLFIGRMAGPHLRSQHQEITIMEIPQDAVLLRIFIGESDKWHHKPLYEAIVLKAREMHMGGATVLRGPMGYGKSSRLHTNKILVLS